MKNKKFDTVKTIRSIRDENYEQTRGMTREELLTRYKNRGKEAMKNLRPATKLSGATN